MPHDHAHGHHAHHGHEHDHHHAHGHGGGHGWAFAWSVTFNLAFVGVELTYGLLAGSMALVADAAHNLGDVAGLAMAWAATRLATIKPSQRRTYGWRKTTVFAALANAVLILVAVGGVTVEAVQRLIAPAAVEGWTVIGVAAIGVVVNALSAALFFAGRKHDVNIAGAFAHLAADAAVSVGVVVSGIVVVSLGWLWVDPVTSVLVSLVIVWGTWGLLRTSFDLAMDAVPPHIDLDAVRAALEGTEGVGDVHDLHVWAMSTSETALTAHLEIAETADPCQLLRELEHCLHDRFGIEHTTLQLETGAPGSCTQGRAGAL